MIAGLLSALAVLAGPQAVSAESLLAAGLVTALLAVVVVLRAASAPPSAPSRGSTAADFPSLRVLLRATSPDAEGHPRARAPGTTR
ncbi:hypothetical protein GCM10025783_06560 [Amnibacterium soli]|uniref:Uncharacterized protein n=1 Tax=Amnibacterium soli TaxID=1282736 RepID=A0ABP8YX05_9MICO